MARVGGGGWLAVVAGLLLVAGCGPSAPYELVPISGKLTYEDGTPIPAHRVTISFESEAPSVNAKTFPRSGRAEVKPDGSFDSVTTWTANDGAIVGKHKVVVFALDDQQNLTGDVPKAYASKATTKLTVEVTGDRMPLEIKVPRPAR